MPSPFVTVPEALEEFARGRMIVLVDDEDRENEGDLTLAAEFVTPDAINFMARFGRGLICLTLTEERADFLRLPPMTQVNTSRFGTAFTQSIEASVGVTTGISARDRAHTIRVAIDAASTPESLARPGHVFPLRARNGGVLVRAGQTEASVDLARLAGLTPAGVICEIMNDDGTMARIGDLTSFCARHDLRMLTVADLIRYRLRHERYVHRVNETRLVTPSAEFRMLTYASALEDDVTHVAFVLGKPAAIEAPLVRIHSHCLLGDIFGHSHCDCRHVLDRSMRAIEREGHGVLVYLHERTHLGRTDGVRQYGCPSRDSLAGENSDERALRQFGLGAQILTDLGVRRLRLLTNTPTHISAFEGYDLQISHCVVPCGDRDFRQPTWSTDSVLSQTGAL